MDFRLAAKSDLPRLQEMYEKIIGNMNRNGIQIWDDVYPCAFFAGDVEAQSLYVLTQDNDIAAAFALCQSNDGEAHVKWKDDRAKALYIDRFGVHVNYLRQGIGRLALGYAMELAKQKAAKYLRLFVVDINQPAIDLYMSYGFKRVDGIYEERINDDFVLREYGFEIGV